MTTLTIQGTYTTASGRPQGFDASSGELTEQEARDLAAQFPKSLRARVTRVTAWRGDTVVHYHRMHIAANLFTNGTTGELNETSQKRIRAFYRHAERLGIELVWNGETYTNSYATREEFDQAAL